MHTKVNHKGKLKSEPKKSHCVSCDCGNYAQSSRMSRSVSVRVYIIMYMPKSCALFTGINMYIRSYMCTGWK